MGIASTKDELRRACLAGNEEACELMRDTQAFAEGGSVKEKNKASSRKEVAQRAYDEESYYIEDLERDAHDEEAYYDEEDRKSLLRAREDRRAEWDMGSADRQFKKLDDEWEDDNALRLLQKLRLKELEKKRQEEFAPADFNAEEFSRRIQNRPTPKWLGDSEGPMTDAERESIFSDTDDFGMPLSTDDFGQTSYEEGVDQRLNVLNSQYGGINYEKSVANGVTPTDNKIVYPSHYTPWLIEQLEGQRKRDEFVQGIKDTATGVYDDVTGFDYKGLGSDIYNKGSNVVQGIQDLFPGFTEDTETTQPGKEFFQGIKSVDKLRKNVKDIISNLINKLANKNKNIEEEYKGTTFPIQLQFAEGGLMEDSSRLWRMESQYPEFQKGISSRVTKEQVPTTPVEEQYMYSPTQQGYAEGGAA